MILDKISSLLDEINNLDAKTSEEVENLRVKYLSKKGEITALFDDFRTVAPEMKREVGQKLNELKVSAQNKINALKEKHAAEAAQAERLDVSREGTSHEIGGRHPISIVKNDIIDIFSRLGFTVAEGPEVEDDWHVFTALNFPLEHPARDMQDTFFINTNPDILLRTHTSSVQVRVMEHQHL